MAEVLGAVASGITIVALAARIGQGIVQLQDFMDQVKEAPEDILYMIEDIQTVSVVLADIDTVCPPQDSESMISKHRQKCIAHCLRVANMLDGVVTEMQDQMRKRKFRGSVKTVLKEPALKRLRERLESAKTLLIMSNQIFSLALWEQSSSRTQQTVDKTLQIVQKLEGGLFQSKAYTAARTKLRVKENSTQSYADRHLELPTFALGKLSNRNQIPAWLHLAKQILESVASWHTSLGWQISFRAYAIMKNHCLAVQYCYGGNLNGLRILFREGRASPFDRCEDGYTLLAIAAQADQFAICEYLLNEGAVPDEYTGDTNSSQFSILQHMLEFGTLTLSFDDRLADRKICVLRKMMTKANIDDFFGEFGITGFMSYAKVFLFILMESNFSYMTLSPEKCAKAIFELRSVDQQMEFASIVRLVLRGRTLCSQLVKTSDKDYGTILNCTAYFLGQLCVINIPSRNNRRRGPRHYNLPLSFSEVEAHKHLLMDLLKAGSDLHSQGSISSATPLGDFLDGIYSGFLRNPGALEGRLDLFSELLTTWLELLQSCGVNLIKYGRKEKYLHRTNQARLEFWGDWGYKKGHFRLINFACGAQPSDWRFWLTEVFEDWFSEFWDMVDHPERSMPGGWDYYPTLSLE